MLNLNPTHIIFLFALGTCIGSFLNVVVWRLPRAELPIEGGPISDMMAAFRALSNPPSHCPNCNIPLKWYDNIPVLGWIKLAGRCRFCRRRISVRYPLVELFTGLMFIGFYIAYYGYQVRACCPEPEMAGVWVLRDSWPIFALYLTLLCALLAASLIDAELYIIPLQIPWLLALLGVAVHTVFDRPNIPGSLNLIGIGGPACAALALGSAAGLVVSIILWASDYIPTSFAEGEPMLEVDREQLRREMEQVKRAGEIWQAGPLPPVYTPRQIRLEIRKEILFLMPPLVLGGVCVIGSMVLPFAKTHWAGLLSQHLWLSGTLGSILGALVGGFVVWITRILGTFAFGKVAMGLGDVHLMFGVGAVLGAAGATSAFFIAPLIGVLFAVYKLIRHRGNEVPYGPFLSIASAVVMLMYCPIMARMGPGLEGIMLMIGDLMHSGPPAR